VWPGSAPNGQRTWNFRWRGRNIDTSAGLWWGDETETEISFGRSDSGELMMTGLMWFGFSGHEAIPFRAVKVEQWSPRLSKPIIVNSTWFRTSLSATHWGVAAHKNVVLVDCRSREHR